MVCVYIHTHTQWDGMEWYSPIKKWEILPPAKTWMDLTFAKLEKNRHYDLLCVFFKKEKLKMRLVVPRGRV